MSFCNWFSELVIFFNTSGQTLRHSGAIPAFLSHVCNKAARGQTNTRRLPKDFFTVHAGTLRLAALGAASGRHNDKGSPQCGEPLTGDSRAAASTFALFSACGLALIQARVLPLALVAPGRVDKLMQLDGKSLEVRLGVLGVRPHQNAFFGKALIDH